MGEIQVAGPKPIKKSEMFFYGFGGLANNLLSMVVASYIIFYFTDVAGLPVAVAGGIYMISKILDAVCDPVVGAWADRTVSRWGRYRPFMMFGSLFAALMYVLLFTAVSFPAMEKAAYYLIVYCLWSVGFTMIVMPYQSVVSILSKDPQKRNILVMVGKLVSIPAGLVVANVFRLVDLFGGGAGGWQRMILFFSLVVVISMWLCAGGIRRFDTREIAVQANWKNTGEKVRLKERLSVIKGNKALFMLVLAFATNNLADSCVSATQSYYAKYVLENMSFISTVGNLTTALCVPVYIMTPFLTRRFAKRDIFKLATVLHVIFPVVLLGLGRGAPQSVVVPLAVLTRTSGMLCNIVAFMMLPDCVDFGFKRSGILSAGLVTSTFTFSNKFSAALGGFISSSLLGVAGYEAGAAQTAGVLVMIMVCMSVPTILSDVASFIGMMRYPIDERKNTALKGKKTALAVDLD